jgi:adenylate kinase family enzyme
MDGSDLARTLIIGNGGSGKTWLAARLGERLRVPVLELDTVHWIAGGGYRSARDKAESRRIVDDFAKGERWIIDGVYGWLIAEAAPRATALVWIDLPEEECLANVRARGNRGEADEVQFASLLAWVASYRRSENLNQFWGHERLFTGFTGTKRILRSRADLDALLAVVD